MSATALHPPPSDVDGTGPPPAPVTPRASGRELTGPLMPALEVMTCTLAVIIGSAAYSPFFAEPSFLLPVAGAAVAGAICGAAVIFLRRPPGLAWALTLLAFVAYLVYAVFPGTTIAGIPGPASLSAVADGLSHGLSRMLTIAPPADVEPVLLIVPVALAFIASLLAAVLTRTRAVLAPLLPPLLAFVAALLLSANAPGFQWQITLGFLGCAFFVVLLRANTAGRVAIEQDATQTASAASAPEIVDGSRSFWHGTAGRVLFGLPLVLLVIALAGTGAGFLPVADGGSRFDLRSLREPPLTLEDRLNPLVDVRRQIEQQSTSAVLTIRTESGAALPVDRVRLAALDTYDGVQWTSDAVFVRTGSTLPAGAQLDNPESVTVDVTMTGSIAPPFLPEFGQPQRIQAQDIGYDQESGQLVTGQRTFDGYHYRLTAAVPTGDIDPATAAAATGPEFDELRRLPEGIDGDPGAGLKALAAEVTAAASTDYEKLQKIADQLKSTPYALDAAPGHSYAALERFLPDAPASADRRVTEEQTVAAFVIMARSLGYSARVAVGYKVNPESVVDGTYSVAVSDADAWAEVAFQGRGWVTFLPTAPRAGDPPPPPENPPGTDQGPDEPVRPDTTGPDVSLDGVLGIGIAWTLVLAILLVLVVVVLIVGAIVLTKQLRRRRRSSRGSTSDRIIGAWQESTNRLRENGYAVPESLTPNEVGQQTGDRFGSAAGTSVATMSPLMAEAIYADEQPDENAVVRAWDLEGELRSILDGRRSLVRRWLTWIDPRPLLPTRTKPGPALAPVRSDRP